MYAFTQPLRHGQGAIQGQFLSGLIIPIPEIIPKAKETVGPPLYS